jgi:SAP domain
MTSITRQYSAVASQASEAVEKAADSWVQGVRKVADRFPALPQVDLVPAVERYFDFVQRALDLNRGITLRWAQAVNTLSGAVREQAESAGQVARERAESVGDVAREGAESFEQAATRQAAQAEQAAARQAAQAEQAAAQQAEQARQTQEELAREARRLEREQARKARQRARERYEGQTKDQLREKLAQRDLPKTGTADELIERLVEADTH